MHKETKLKLWLAGAAIVALVAAYWLPRRTIGNASVNALAQNASQATVPAALLGGDTSVSSTPSPAATRFSVYVCGDVRHPGVYEFAQNRRVIDAVARAGGPLPDADLEQLNLAEPLRDAMKIDVPKKGERLAAALGDLTDSGSSRHRARSHSSRSGHKLQPGQSLNINTATESELTALPGVGSGLARRIVEYRTANGPFRSVDDLQNVSGIGPSKFDRMAPYINL